MISHDASYSIEYSISNDDEDITEEVISSEKPQDETIKFEQPIVQCKDGEFKVAFIELNLGIFDLDTAYSILHLELISCKLNSLDCFTICSNRKLSNLKSLNLSCNRIELQGLLNLMANIHFQL